METTKNKLSPYESIFFNKLSNYLDTKMYFFGSIQRYDYFPGISDIDVDIFTDNVSRTISQIQNYLHINKNETTKFIYKINRNNNKYDLITGYKIKYTDPEKPLNIEFSIYNEKIKEIVLYEHNRKTSLPYLVTFFLVIVKYLYYVLSIIPKFIYKFFKNFLMNTCIDGKDAEFVVINIEKEKGKE
jgi:hypothetical protein